MCPVFYLGVGPLCCGLAEKWARESWTGIFVGGFGFLKAEDSSACDSISHSSGASDCHFVEYALCGVLFYLRFSRSCNFTKDEYPRSCRWPCQLLIVACNGTHVPAVKLAAVRCRRQQRQVRSCFGTLLRPICRLFDLPVVNENEGNFLQEASFLAILTKFALVMPEAATYLWPFSPALLYCSFSGKSHSWTAAHFLLSLAPFNLYRPFASC